MTSDSVSSVSHSAPLPEGWRMVTFGEVARQVKTKVKPADTNLDRYVGLEHLDPESLHIRRWGVPEDVTGEKIVVGKGDIIFGKRRAYQRKVAIADFDCICSAHAMVLQPKEDVIIKEIFPFFLQSDQFMNRAVQISVGGLSPTINWKDLAKQVFPLPPIDEQRRIAEILWAAEDVIVKNEAFVTEVEHYKQLMMQDLFSKGIGHEEYRQINEFEVPREWALVSLKSVLSERVVNGYSAPEVKEFEPVNILTLTAVTQNDIARRHTKQIRADPKRIENYWIQKDDIFIERSNTKELVGLASLYDKDDSFAIFPDILIRVRPNQQKIVPKYLVEYLRSPKMRLYFSTRAKGTAGSMVKIDHDTIESLPLPLPPLPEQRQIAAILSATDDTIAAAQADVKASKTLKMRLINQLLSKGDVV